jgi:large subunit ribosomal protein L24
MAAKIRRDDEVIVLTGKDKGKRGKVKNVLSSGKLVVEGINLVKKHQKPVPALNQPGGIVECFADVVGDRHVNCSAMRAVYLQ